MPDDLLAEVDAQAARRGTTRSALLREFTNAALRSGRAARAEAMRALTSEAGRHGGGAAEAVKATRPAR